MGKLRATNLEQSDKSVCIVGMLLRHFFNVLCSKTAGDLAGISVRMTQCAQNTNIAQCVQSVSFNAPSFYFRGTCKQICPLPTELQPPSCNCMAVINEKSAPVSLIN